MKKKIAAMVLAMGMSFAVLTACDSGSKPEVTETTETETDVEAEPTEETTEDSAEDQEATEKLETTEATEEPEAPAIETETHTITNDAGAQMSLEWIKDDCYSFTENGNQLTIYDEVNNETVDIYLYYDYPDSSRIFKGENDFGGDHHDYAEITIGDHTGWEVYNGEGEYKCEYLISDKDADGMVYAVSFRVQRSSVNPDAFDVKEFVNSDTFATIRESVTLVKEKD